MKPDARLGALDGLRGVAVLLVLAYHYLVRWCPPAADRSYYPYGSRFAHLPIVGYGWAGVELFFVVSGFVILMTLERSGGAWDFARRRFARLWPALVVCALITSLLAPLGPAEWRAGPLSFVLSVFCIDPGLVGQILHAPGLKWVDGVYWTLFIEVRFYVMAALLFALAPRRFLEALTGLSFISFALGLRVFQYPGRELAWLLLLPSFLPYFTFGAALYRARSAGGWSRTTLVCALASALMILAGGFWSFDLPDGRPVVFFWANLAILTLAAVAALDGPGAGLLAFGPLSSLGAVSYSLYLIHSNAGVILIGLASRFVPWPLALAGVTGALLASAFGLFRWVERPGKNLILAAPGLRRREPLETTALGPASS